MSIRGVLVPLAWGKGLLNRRHAGVLVVAWGINRSRSFGIGAALRNMFRARDILAAS
jgi:hypothetical protein